MKMDCRQIEELMMDYLYQELDADQTSAYRAHLTTCASCGAQLAGYERTRLAVRELPDIEPPAEVTARLLQEAARRPVRALEPVGAAATIGARGVAAASMEGKGAWAWLTGWMQPIFAHPGFAAAAGLILVAGIAGLLAMRGKLDLSASAPQSAAPPPAAASVPEAEAADAYKRNDTQLARERAAVEPGAGFVGTAPTVANAPPPAPPTAGRMEQPKAVGSARLVQPKPGGELSGYLDLEAKDRRQAGEKKADKNVATPAPAPEPRAEAPARPADVPAEAELDSSTDSAGRGATAKKEARPPAAPAPMQHEASRPAKSVAQKPRAAVSDDENGAEGGVVGGTMAGEASSAPSGAGAPAPAAAAPMSPPPPAPATKGKSAPSAQENEAKKLHGQARMKANTGDCSTALKLRERIYRVDPAYFERSVRNDADLGKCTAARKKAAESRDAKMPSPSRDEAPAANLPASK
jgi:anti-sigma factor RsiW